ncbi:enoyl-CoA hydratase/isomerase family protein [Nonomuraea sp. NPDC050153]|uniref:enoyl-CoA hydratase/isomerase family protein n=1 Tax=Nonomuraea sp. NPDC050153 TaxID=3364359 RepID=UPI00379C92AB
MPPLNDTVKIEDGPDRVLVRLDRPQVRNAIDAAMVADLHEVCAELERRPRVLVLTGADGIFAAGADIRERCSLRGGRCGRRRS